MGGRWLRGGSDGESRIGGVTLLMHLSLSETCLNLILLYIQLMFHRYFTVLPLHIVTSTS